MTHGLNFYRLPRLFFLSFVSFLIGDLVAAQTSPKPKDEFSVFENEAKETMPHKNSAPKAVPPSTKPIVAVPTPVTATLILSEAEELYRKGSYEKCTLLLWKQVDKLDRRGLILLAKAHEKRLEASEMIRALNVQLGKEPNDFEALMLIGRAQAMLKKTKDAMESYKKALELNPKYEPAYRGLIDLYEKRDPPNLYELRILFQDMMDNIGRRPEYFRKLCEINTLDATYEVAMNSCREAIQKEPKNADPYVYLGMGQKAIGEDAAGLGTLKKAAQDFPKSEFAQFQYAKTLEDAKNYVDAMKFYKNATEADEKAARSWVGLANASFEIRKYDLALIAYAKACKIDKKNAVAFRRATTVLRNQKNSEWIGKFEESSESCLF